MTMPEIRFTVVEEGCGCYDRKDYNHPSVIMYSIGNEISELGTLEGQKLCKEISDYVRRADETRAVTCGINLMLASMAAKGSGIYGEKKNGKENKMVAWLWTVCRPVRFTMF